MENTVNHTFSYVYDLLAVLREADVGSKQIRSRSVRVGVSNNQMRRYLTDKRCGCKAAFVGGLQVEVAGGSGQHEAKCGRTQRADSVHRATRA